MLLDALEIGVSDDEFGDLCIRQLFRHFVVASRKHRREHNARVESAWWAVSFEIASHTGKGKRKAPDLKKFLMKDPEAPEKTPQQRHAELKGSLHILAAQFGGRVREVKQVTGG